MLANNGQEAVDATGAGEFHVILMDVHMPVMDGLTATRLIRENEHGSESHTDHCPDGGRDCAGPRKLYLRGDGQLRQQAVSRRGAGAGRRDCDVFIARVVCAVPPCQGEVPSPQTSTPSASTDDTPCLDWQGALRNLEGDEEFLRELVTMYLVQYPAMRTRIAEAVHCRASDELQRAAHSLKGSSQVIGGKAVAASALELERLGPDGNAPQGEPALAALDERLQALELALKAAMTGD